MDPGRQRRKEEISKALTFIQSSLAYPEPEGYQDFLTRLVCNLLHEGNAAFTDKEWESAAREFSEGLNVSSYAAGEDIQIPTALLESLYVNRAAAYHSLGEYEKGVNDCDSALELCKKSPRALYRKALCLKELGKHKEAYSCTTDCLLISGLDKQVEELSQELSAHLRLKNRKPYVTAKDDALSSKVVTNGNKSSDSVKVSAVRLGNGVNPLSSFAPVTFPSMPQPTVTSSLATVPSVPYRVDTFEDSELMGDDLDSLLDSFPTEQKPTEPNIQEHMVPPVLPAPTPQLPPAFFSSSVSQLNSLDSFSGVGISFPALDVLTCPGLDALDSFSSVIGGGASALASGLTPVAVDTLDDLDCLDDFLDAAPSASASTGDVNESKSEFDMEEMSLDDLLDELDPLEVVSDPVGLRGDVLKPGVKAVDHLDSLDVLDSFSCVERVGAALPAASIGRTGIPGSHSAAAPVIRSSKSNYKEKNFQAPVAATNPLSHTHEFLQACSACYPRQGQGIYTYVHKPDLVHSCKRNILLCRRKAGYPSEWTRVRPMPPNASFSGPFVLCKELLKSGDLGLCKYGEKCTFAYNQLEIDVWNEERKGTLDRSLLFITDPVNSVIHLLQENKGTFVFLCQECFDNKPKIISKRCRDSPTICSNTDVHHTFDANKCLVFVVKSLSVTYKKVRSLSVTRKLDLCRHEVRYGCPRKDDCQFAHSYIELKTWRVQRHTGISQDEIVKISTKYYDEQGQNSIKPKGNKFSPRGVGNKPKVGGGGGAGKSLNMRMKFVCAQCWRDSRTSEPDKTLKHCTAKAKHAWTKDRQVLLVRSVERSKWVQVRPLPQNKIPLHYDICNQILEKGKCSYLGNCTFAHSQEEKEMWMYMKNNKVYDMQQMYDLWLSSLNPKHPMDEAPLGRQTPEEKYIAMPTDNAEPMNDFYCCLCGKHSNSERQWQQHISSEKHKDRVFSCEGEDEALMWSYRFPGACFQLCPKLESGCPDGVSCDYAHSLEELQEWTERRGLLRQKLAKAREDMLIMPDESDFGKYSFLLQD